MSKSILTPVMLPPHWPKAFEHVTRDEFDDHPTAVMDVVRALNGVRTFHQRHERRTRPSRMLSSKSREVVASFMANRRESDCGRLTIMVGPKLSKLCPNPPGINPSKNISEDAHAGAPPSSPLLPFFAFCGPGSHEATTICACGYHPVSHSPQVMERNKSLTCTDFRPARTAL